MLKNGIDRLRNGQLRHRFSQPCISGRWKDPWTPTVNGEGLEQAYAKMDQSESLLHAKFPIVERLKDKIK